MAQYILGVDEGTTTARAFVVDEHSTVRGYAQAELTQLHPRPGCLEQDPTQILNVQLEVIRAALRDAGIAPDQLTVAGLTNQRETAVVWEKSTGRPIHNAVVWASRQSVDVAADWIERGIAPLIRQRTGLITDAFYTASKIRWILDRVPGAQQRAERGELLAGTVDTWLTWNLTGRRSFVTDYSNASRTMMMSLHTLDWDDELLGHFGIPRRMLPEIISSDGHFGDLEATFGTPVPIRAVLGDQQAGLFGQAGYTSGRSKMTFGTSGVLNVNTGDSPVWVDGMTPSVAWGLGGSAVYEVEGVAFAMGKTMQWLRDELRLIHAAPESEWYAGQVPSTEGVYLVPAFTGLAAPTWDPYARAAIVGISNSTNRLHIIRAAVESMVYQTRDVVDAMRTGSSFTFDELRVDGGAVRNNLLCQLQADILGIPVVRPKNTEATVFGVMLLAALAHGMFGHTDELDAAWSPDRTFEPQMSRDRADEMYAGWLEARDLTGGWTKKVPVR